MSSLQSFFSTMRPFLLGEISSRDVEAALGAVPSGAARLEFYRSLVESGYDGIVRKIYPFTMNRLGPVGDAVIGTYIRSHPPGHWEPNQMGAAFPTFILERDDLASWIAELALYEWFELATYLSPAEDMGEGLRLNPTLNALQFLHDIASWVRDGHAEEAGAQAPPERAHILLVYRHPDTHLCRFLEATPWTQVVVTAIEEGRDPLVAATESGGDKAQAEHVIAQLLECGLLLR